MWHNLTFETDPTNPHSLYLFEPLATAAPEDSQPYCCYIGTVIFYRKPFPGNLEEIDRVQSQWDLLGQRFSDEIEGWAGVAPFVWNQGQLYELGGGTVLWYKGRWVKRWEAGQVTEDDGRWGWIPKEDFKESDLDLISKPVL